MILDLITTKIESLLSRLALFHIIITKSCSRRLYYETMFQSVLSFSTIACKLSECLSEQELTMLAADLVVLSDMLANLLAHQDIYEDASQNTL